MKSIMPLNYIRNKKPLAKGLLVAVLTGLAGGLLGGLFHMSIDLVTELRESHGFILLFLPLCALLVSFVYHRLKKFGPLDTDRVFNALHREDKVPFPMLPAIFFGSVVSHLAGASVGREGAALQLGGSMGYNMAKAFGMDSKVVRLSIMCGMSAVFTALFGTPAAASIFAMEVTSVGAMRYGALLPCVISSSVAFVVAGAMGIEPISFAPVETHMTSPVFIMQVILLSFLCALLSIVFCRTIRCTERGAKRLIPDYRARALVLGLVVLGLTYGFGTTDYNGAGMNIITSAMSGSALGEAFVLKLIFTSVSIAAGFKGGEIVPAFFVGSTFGCVVGPLLGLDASCGAALGFVALFCGVVNCPLASLVLALEIFGGGAVPMFAVVCAVSYALSGKDGLYKSQKILYSKQEI